MYNYVYLDYAASAPESVASIEAGHTYDSSAFAGANPNSLHSAGRQAARALDAARATIAHCLGDGFRPLDITFTSGGTESNNLALLGLSEAFRTRDARRNRVVISAIEHDSVLDLAPQLRRRGFDVSFCPVTKQGALDLTALEKLLTPDVALVSVMAANNETGVIQPLEKVALCAHSVGACIHTDAVQAFARIPLSLKHVDAVSVAAHKIGGPVGVGALAVRQGTPLTSQSWGGGQEQGRRAGTQNVRGACCFAAAAEAACDNMLATAATIRSQSCALIAAVCKEGTGVEATVASELARLPGIVHLLIRNIDSNTLVLALDELGFAVSAASACSSNATATSHVLQAMGVDSRLAEGALRISFDERVSSSQLARFAEALLSVIARFQDY